MATDDRKQRVIDSLESLILHPSTGEHERNAGIGRWEAITGKKWTGKKHNAYANHEKTHSNPSGGQQRAKQRGSGGFGRDNRGRAHDFGNNECTDKQYDFVKSISDFFRWKCPDRHRIEYDEAQDFLNRYADLFKMFASYSRNFSQLKKLFEAFGIDWSMTKRTFKWRAFHEC